MRNSKLTALFAITLISSSAAAPVAQLGGFLGSVLDVSSSSSMTDSNEADPTPIATTSVDDVMPIIMATPVAQTQSLIQASFASTSSLRSSTTPIPFFPTLVPTVRISSSSSSSRVSSPSSRMTFGGTITLAVSTSSRSSISTSSRSSTSVSSKGTTTSRSSSSTKTTSSSTVLTTGVAKQTPLSTDDVAILQLALYLEKLEGTLYSKGFNQFNEQQFEMEGFGRPFRDNVGLIVKQEAVHASTITSILVANGKTPIENCTYNFNFPSVKNFIATGNMVSTVGVGAYLAGGGILKDNAFLLGAASSILTVEARHDAYLRGGIGANPYPSSFDTIVPAPYAYNLAQAFIVKCPTQLNYPIYPKLNLTSPVIKPNLLPNLKAGQNITFAFNPATIPNFATLSQKPLYIALLNSVNNVSYTPIVPCGTGCASILLPAGLSNIAFAVMTNLFGATLDNLVASGTLAGPCELPIN